MLREKLTDVGPPNRARSEQDRRPPPGPAGGEEM